MWIEKTNHNNQKRPLALGLILTGATFRLLPTCPTLPSWVASACFQALGSEGGKRSESR